MSLPSLLASAAAFLLLASTALPAEAQTRREKRESRRAGSGAAPAPAPASVGKGLESATRIDRRNSRAQPAAKQETVQGKVLSTDPETGTAQVQTSRGVVTVRGRPSDTAGLKAGDKTFLNVQKTGGDLWVEQAAPSGFGSADVTQQPGMGAASTVNSGAYQQRGQAGGVISAVDTKAGTFTVDGKTFSAHPSQLQGLKAGQQVSIDYGVVGESGWADRVYTGAAPKSAVDKPKPPPPPPAPVPDENEAK